MRTPFERLDPPPGGLELLRARLAERPSRDARSFLWLRPIPATATALVLILALVVVVVKLGAPIAESESTWNLERHPAWVALGLGAPPDHSVTVRPTDQNDLALMPMLETEEVLIYRIGRRTVELLPDEEG